MNNHRRNERANLIVYNTETKSIFQTLFFMFQFDFQLVVFNGKVHNLL